ncbi:hypothetical protein ACOSP7_026022 [Xanthoceras sorbifolium]
MEFLFSSVSAGSITKFSGFTFLFVFLLSCSTSTSTSSAETYGAFDPKGNITINWDVLSWTPDGYVAIVTIYNFQKHHGIKAPGTPYNQQIANCCRGGVLKPWAASSFQLSVGAAGTTNKTVRMPKHFTLKAPPGHGYTCGPAKIVEPTRFLTPDKRRFTRAMMTWIVICKYSMVN